ncbi:MAG: ester cyclase [Candidatus Synoicihabitans palmerolidicus]|nr:ester cyclase [Candidatus Synoicihabitans palmerolidicus]
MFVRWRSVSRLTGSVQPYNSQGINHLEVKDGKIVAWHTAHEFDSTALNKKTINSLIEELWNQRDVSVIERHYAPDAKVWISEWEHGGPENVQHDAERFFRGWSTSTTRVTHLIAEADLVTIRWETVATHDGLYGEIPATGKTLTYQGMDLFRLVDGRIAESWSFWDAYGVCSALGVLKMEIPPAPAPTPTEP